MREIDRILQQIENHIKEKTYEQVETDKIELKDLSAGDDWKQLYKSVCAFLNAKGGIIVIGIKEDTKQKQFNFTKFNPHNESKVKQLSEQFTDDEGKKIDLSEFIRPDLMELRPFLDNQVCLVFIEKLPDEQKYVLYNGEAYERQLTGDKRIPPDKIKAQKELKIELQNARELQFVPNATLNDLDIDKLNEYIQRLNKDIKVETLKPDISSALSFLSRKKFVRDNNPTLLGMLVCGKYIFDYAGGRCQVDCFFDTGIEVANDKKVFKDNIISLMESCIGFVFSKTGTGIKTEKGGSVLFEYPERVVRETVNNALAHRDYSNDKFANITIIPNKHIEIRNPGQFKQEQLLRLDELIPVRRIIPIAKAQNPNLADVLKTFDRWEGRGWGMSTLTNFALANSIDIPYYRLYAENDIGLFVQKGKVLDDEMIIWINSFSKYILHKTNGRELTNEQKTVLAYFYKSELLNKLERYTILLTPDNNHYEVIKDLEVYGIIAKLSSSPALYPVYIVDRILTKKEFSTEMRKIFGGAYDNLKNEYKAILEAIYQHNEFSTTSKVSANLIGNYLYLRDKKAVIDIKDYDIFKRKVRNWINKLEKNGYIVRKDSDKPDYIINKSFSRKPSLFDN
ncbi:MAG: putative DNA binding domain-containing protein [Nitrospinae bacterium]|nr:putative DNA binding domain-containing protein [Nitrospinota bacterium]